MFEISLDKPSYRAGETVVATVHVKLDKPVSGRGLFADLICRERKRVKYRTVMDKYDYDREHELGVARSSHIQETKSEEERIWFKESKRLSDVKDLREGDFQVQFVLPKNAPATSKEFGHDNLIHVWRIKAKIDIPFRIDINSEKEVFVEGLV